MLSGDIKRARGKVNLSPINLSREAGEVELPKASTVRVIGPARYPGHLLPIPDRC